MANIYWVGGAGTWNTSSTTNWANASGGTGGTGTVPTAADNVFFNSGSGTPGTVTMTGALLCLNITVSVTGWTFATGTTPTLAISGDLALTSGTTWTSTGTITFNSTASQTITTASTAFSCGITFNGTGGTWQLQDALTIGSIRTVTLTNGTLNLNNNNITCGLFSSTNSNTRTLAFGTGQFYLTGNNSTIWATNIVTGLTYSGSLNANATYSGNTGTRNIVCNSGVGYTAAQYQQYGVNFNITAGSDSVTFSSRCGSVDFTGFSGTLTSSNLLSYGSIKFNASMTIAAGTATIGMFAETGSWTLQTAGLTFDRLFGFGGSATGTATYTLVDNLTVISGTSTGTVSLQGSGTLNLNSKTLTCAIFNSNNSNTRTLAFGTGTIAVTGSGATAWNCTTATNLTTTGTGTITMTSATAKTFVGGGAAYAATLDQGGAGALTITGSNTLANMTASIAPTSAASILFTAGATTSLTSGFDVDGTAANTITVSSATAAAHTLSLASGTVVANYLNLSYSTATGGAVWLAPTTSVNGGNNSGWQFTTGSAVISVGSGITIGRGITFS